MQIDLTCTSCGKSQKAPASLAGKRVKCSRCSNAMRVPELAPREVEPAEEPVQAEAVQELSPLDDLLNDDFRTRQGQPGLSTSSP